MRETLILLKVQRVTGGDGVQRFALSWTLRGSPIPGIDGGVCCDDIDEAMKHVKLAIEEDLADQPQRVVQTATQADIAGALPKEGG